MDIIRAALLKNDVEALRGILAANPDFRLADPKFTCFLRTPLHVAALHGYVEFARVIVNHDPLQRAQLVKEVDSQGCTPLHLASTRHNNVEMVTLLLEANTDACIAADHNGGTPLHLAAMRDDVKIMDLLIDKCPEAIHQVLPNTKETILHLCVKHNKLQALKKLVDYLLTNRANPPANIQDPISVNSVDSSGNTILHLAAKMKRIEIFEVLIKSDSMGFDINIRNEEGLTALDMLDRKEMEEIGISCYDYDTTREVPQEDREVSDPRQDREVSQQDRTSRNEWLKERMNTIMIVAALIAGIAFQAVINPPGGVFQEDSKINVIEDPVRFIYYLRNIINDYDMSEGFRSYDSHINNLPLNMTTGGNITVDDTITYRSNFVLDLLRAAQNTESLARSVFPDEYQYLAPAIVLEDDWWKNIISEYNKSSMGGGSGFSPYIIRYAGTAIFAYASPSSYDTYMVLNSVSLVLCGVTILLVTFDAFKQRPPGSTASASASVSASVSVGYLEVLLATAVACIGLSYMIVIQNIGPPFYGLSSIKRRVLLMLGAVICTPLATLICTPPPFFCRSVECSSILRDIYAWNSRVYEFTFLMIKIVLFIIVVLGLWRYFI